VADLVNQQLARNTLCAPHQLDLVSKAPPTSADPALRLTCGPKARMLPKFTTPTGWPRPLVWDVYVDDFIGMVQGLPAHHRHIKRVLLHALDNGFCKLEAGDDPHHQEPASLKKMLKGDATWTNRKVILGWTINTLPIAVELPPLRSECLFELLDSVAPGQKRVSLNKWQTPLGEL
jgi:hypothetical protein